MVAGRDFPRRRVMNKIFFGPRSWLIGLPVLALIVMTEAHADDADLRSRILALNKVTGSNVVDAELVILSKDPKAKELLQAGLAIAKSTKETLTYNAAII